MTDQGEERRARPLHCLHVGGSGAGKTEREADEVQGRRRGVLAQAPAGKNDHGDSEEADKAQGRWAWVQAPALRREPRRREAGCTHPV